MPLRTCWLQLVGFLVFAIAGLPLGAQESVTEKNLIEAVARIADGTDPLKVRVELGEECLAVLKVAPNDDLELDVRYALGIAFCQLNRFVEAIEQLTVAEQLAQKAELDEVRAHCLWLHGSSAFSLGHLEEALRVLTTATEVAGFAELLDVVWRVGNMLGLTLEQMGETESALASFSMALEATDKLQNLDGKSTVLGNLGIVYMNLGEFDLALDIFKRAHEIIVQIGNRAALQTALANLGDVYINLRRYEEALQYHKQALEVRREFGSELEIARSYQSIGVAYFNMRLYEEALSELENALEIRERLGLESELAITLTSMAWVYGALDREEEALEIGERGGELAEKLKLKGRHQWVLETLGNMYERQGKFELAMESFQALKQVAEERRSMETSRELAKFRAEFEVKEKEQQIALLSSQAALQESKLKKQRFERNALVIGGLFVTIAAISGWLAWASLRRATSKIQSLEEGRARAEKLESLGLLAGGIAHDFNNILATVVGNLSLLKHETRLLGSGRELLRDAEQALGKGEQLAGQLLSFAKGGTMRRDVQPVDRLIQGAAENALRNREVTLCSELNAELWYAEVDAAQIKQLIFNVVKNAEEASVAGSTITLRATNIWLDETDGSLPSGPYLQLAVEDQGSGIPAAIRDKIFDPYFSTKKFGGGLGLALAYATAQRHNGTIECRSNLDGGTTIELLIPALPRVEKTMAVPTDKVAEGKGRVLVMDDEALLLQFFGRALESMGYECTLVGDGETAVEAFKRAQDDARPFELVILDLTIVEGMGGLQVMERLLELEPRVQAIVTSGYSGDPVMANFRDYGFVSALPKPFDLAALSQAAKSAAPTYA